MIVFSIGLTCGQHKNPSIAVVIYYLNYHYKSVLTADNMTIIVETQEELQDLVSWKVSTGRKYNMEINIEKS